MWYCRHLSCSLLSVCVFILHPFSSFLACFYSICNDTIVQANSSQDCQVNLSVHKAEILFRKAWSVKCSQCPLLCDIVLPFPRPQWEMGGKPKSLLLKLSHLWPLVIMSCMCELISQPSASPWRVHARISQLTQFIMEWAFTTSNVINSHFKGRVWLMAMDFCVVYP